MFNNYSVIILGIMAGLLLSVSGCGSNVRGELGNTEQVASTIMALADAAGSERYFQEAFVENSAPENRKDYAVCAFDVVGTPSISGSDATANVKVTTGMIDGQSSERNNNNKPASKETFDVVWKLVETDTGWKIKEAPLQ